MTAIFCTFGGKNLEDHLHYGWELGGGVVRRWFKYAVSANLFVDVGRWDSLSL